MPARLAPLARVCRGDRAGAVVAPAVISFVVYGVAQPQGSKTAFVRGNRASLTDGRRKGAREAFAGWRASVATAAQDWQRENNKPLWDGPLVVEIDFWLPRPKSAPKRVQFPTTRPDLDKLVRAVLDACKGIVIQDDSQVVNLCIAKRFANSDQPPSARIRIYQGGESSKHDR